MALDPKTFGERFVRIYACGHRNEVNFFRSLREVCMYKDSLVAENGRHYKRSELIATLDVITGPGIIGMGRDRERIRNTILSLRPRPNGFRELYAERKYIELVLPFFYPDGQTVRERRVVPYDVHKVEFYLLRK